MKWKDRVKIVLHASDIGSEYSQTWEEVYQIFKERIGREIYFERTKVSKLECKHQMIVPGDFFASYKNMGDRFCRDCGEKL